MRDAFTRTFADRGVPAGSAGGDAWIEQVRAILAESAVGLARAGFSDERAVDLVAHGYDGHVDQGDPVAVRAQLRSFTRALLSGRHAH